MAFVLILKKKILNEHIDSGNVVFSLCRNFCKAFDFVNHEIMLSKLNSCGVRGITLEWFSSYITNREQYACINNVDSNHKIIQFGVLQLLLLF